MTANIVSFEITGVTPLMMHNEQLANPMNETVREIQKISKKRSKTLADYQELAYLEFIGGIYHDDVKPFIPDRCVEACIRDAAKTMRLGKSVERGITIVGSQFGQVDLIYSGPKSKDELWKKGFYDQRTVKVGQARVLRTRPIFRNWSSKFDVQFNDEYFETDKIIDIVNLAGRSYGLCEYRPKYGRFTAKVV